MSHPDKPSRRPPLNRARSLKPAPGPKPDAAEAMLNLFGEMADEAIGAAAEAQEPEIPFDEMIAAIFLGYDPKLFAERLALLNDGLPLPQIFTWASDQEDPTMAALAGEEKRTLSAFQQILEQDRKSSKHLEAMRELRQAHPDVEVLALILLNYLNRWDKDAYRQLESELLSAHPDWLLLRFTHASVLLLDQDPTAPDPAVLARFQSVMEHRLELHQHLEAHPEVALSETLVLTFYTATAAWHILNHQYARAVYSLNLADAAGADNLDPIMSFLLMQILQNDQLEPLKNFLEPLRLERERRWTEETEAADAAE